MTKETGGAAFPTTLDQANGFRDGMTMRDYFAAKVVAELLITCPTNARACEEAYKIADAMLEARK